MGSGPLKEKSVFLFNQVAYLRGGGEGILVLLSIAWYNAHRSERVYFPKRDCLLQKN